MWAKLVYGQKCKKTDRVGQKWGIGHLWIGLSWKTGAKARKAAGECKRRWHKNSMMSKIQQWHKFEGKYLFKLPKKILKKVHNVKNNYNGFRFVLNSQIEYAIG
jgi:hypothetical protein